jgi:DNA-binding NtrC family response regulator
VKIHLAILDFMMPKLRGDQLAKRLNPNRPGIKIIFVSGYNEVIEVAKKLKFDVFGVFMKPFDPDVMEKLTESNDHANFI